MHYSDKVGHVRVDIFRETGKYYTTEAVDMTDYYDSPPLDAFEAALNNHFKGRLSGFTAVCIEPYNEYSYPLLTKIP